MDNFSELKNVPESINVVLERENKKVYFSNEPILELKVGDSLKILPFEFLKGQVRFQVWNKGEPIGLVPDDLTDTILSAQSEYDIECIFGGLVPKKEKNFSCLVKIVFKKSEEKADISEIQPAKEPEFKEFEVPETEEKEKIFSGVFTVDDERPFYQQNHFIILMCILVMPFGFYLLWRYGRQPAGRKVFLCIFLIFTVTAVFFGVKNGVGFVGRLITGSKPETVTEEFLNQWQRNDWVSMAEQTPPSWRERGGSAYKLSQWFENYKKVDSYSISEIYKDGNKNICVAVVIIDSKRYRLKFNVTEEKFRYYVDVRDLRSYIDLLENTSVDPDFSPDDKEGTTYCYADGSNMIYHYSNNCSAAGDSLVRIPESEALYRHYGPCGRCAR